MKYTLSQAVCALGLYDVHRIKPGHDLHEEAEAERAAPDISPPRAARNVFVERGVHQRAKAGAVIEPIEEAIHSIELPFRDAPFEPLEFHQDFLRPGFVFELHRQRIESAATGPEQFLAIDRKPALMAGALEFFFRGVEFHGAAQMRASGGERRHVVGIFARASQKDRADSLSGRVRPGVDDIGDDGKLARHAVGRQRIERTHAHKLG